MFSQTGLLMAWAGVATVARPSANRAMNNIFFIPRTFLG